MRPTTLEGIFATPWGILHERRAEVERGSFGSHERIMREEIARRFMSIDAVATAMDCHRDTATKRLRDTAVRFIEGPHGKRLFLVDDVRPVIEAEVAATAARRAKKAAV